MSNFNMSILLKHKCCGIMDRGYELKDHTPLAVPLFNIPVVKRACLFSKECPEKITGKDYVNCTILYTTCTYSSTLLARECNIPTVPQALLTRCFK